MNLSVTKNLQGKPIQAQDGEIGSVEEVYFDDDRWVVRYLVVNTGHWLPGRKVLISPASVAGSLPDDSGVRVELTTEEVKQGPGTDSDMPVSRQFEEAHARYYGYPFYWDGPYLWGAAQHPVGSGGPVTSVPGGSASRERVRELKQAEQRARESHLRSSKEVAGYRVTGTDGVIGHVEDFLFDSGDWSITGIVIDTHAWLPGGEVEIPVETVKHIDWVTRELRLGTTRDEVKRRGRKAP